MYESEFAFDNRGSPFLSFLSEIEQNDDNDNEVNNDNDNDNNTTSRIT